MCQVCVKFKSLKSYRANNEIVTTAAAAAAADENIIFPKTYVSREYNHSQYEDTFKIQRDCSVLAYIVYFLISRHACIRVMCVRCTLYLKMVAWCTLLHIYIYIYLWHI